MITNLEEVDPRGRVDVLAYRAVQKGTELVEQHYGLQGIWNAIKPHVNGLVSEHITGMEIPAAAVVLLSILQANYQPKIEGKNG
jgi:hypothetical protein